MAKVTVGKPFVYFVIGVFGIGFVVIMGGVVIEPLRMHTAMVLSKHAACEKRHQHQVDSLNNLIQSLRYQLDSVSYEYEMSKP